MSAIEKFRAMHERGCFVMPNPWDPGGARWLRHLRFPAIATTSAGFAFARGLPDGDGAVTRDAMLAHITDLVAAVDLPVNADFENGYAHDPDGVADSVRRCVATGAAGLSIEDSTGVPGPPLDDLPLAVARVRAARRAIDETGSGVLLTARAECYLVGHPDAHAESIRRLTAYAEAGADVLYAPGPTAPDEIRAIVAAVAPRPVNLLCSAAGGLTVAEVAALGVRRISVGGALARAAWTGFIRAAQGIAERGSFDGFAGATSHKELNGFFRGQRKPLAPT